MGNEDDVTDHLLVERDAHVVTVTMNRPESRNAWSGEMLGAMADAWDMIDSDPDVRVAILTGAGGDDRPLIFAPLRMVAPIPTRQPSSISHPRTMELWPTTYAPGAIQADSATSGKASPWGSRFSATAYTSTSTASPCPPPEQRAARPLPPPLRRSP